MTINTEELRKLIDEATPGPWWREPDGITRPDADGNVRYDLPRIVRFGSGQSICKCHLIGGNDPDQAIANARLIALAPDLAADNIALQAEVERLREALADLYQCDEWGVFSMDEVQLRARAVLNETQESE